MGAPIGIHSGDRVVRAASFEEAAPAFERLVEMTRLQGGLMQIITGCCAQWPWRAKDLPSVVGTASSTA